MFTAEYSYQNIYPGSTQSINVPMPQAPLEPDFSSWLEDMQNYTQDLGNFNQAEKGSSTVAPHDLLLQHSNAQDHYQEETISDEFTSDQKQSDRGIDDVVRGVTILNFDDREAKKVGKKRPKNPTRWLHVRCAVQ
jgi:hypothetical protein